MNNVCKDSSECAFGDVLQECYEFNDFRPGEEFFCDCSSWLGWGGENCTTPTATIYYLRISSIILTFPVLFIICVSFKTLVLAYKHKLKKNISLRNMNPIFWVE